jgi:hypothetical protein
MPSLHLRTIPHKRSKGCLDAMPIQYARARFNSGHRSSVRSQEARAIFIRLGENNADCSVSPARSHQHSMG